MPIRLPPQALLLPLLALSPACPRATDLQGGETFEDSPEAPLAGGIQILDPGNPRPYFHDFGSLAWGEVVEHRFRLKNMGTTQVDLLDMQGACSCTQLHSLAVLLPSGERREGDPRKKDGMLRLQPGDDAELVVRVDSGKTTANQNKLEVMRLRTNSLETPYLTFEVRLLPQRLFQLTPPTLDLQDTPQTAGEMGVVRIVTSVSGAKAKILGVQEQGKRVRASLEETFSLDEFLWVVSIEVPPMEPLGLLQDKVVLATTDEQGEGDAGRLSIDVWTRVVADVKIYPELLNLGALSSSEHKSVWAKVKALPPGMRVRVLESYVEGAEPAQFEVSFAAKSPDAQGRSAEWELEISAPAGLPTGRVAATLVVKLDDPQYPVLRTSLSGYVR